MSDLISRSELLKEIETWGGDVEALHEYIREMPTAYDIDKVVEELEIERKTANNTYNSFNMDIDLGRVFGLEKAIEIVKAGGVNEVKDK